MQQHRADPAQALGVRTRAAQAGSGGLLLLALVVAEAAIVWLVAALVLVAPDRPGAALPALPVFAVVYLAALLPRLLDALDVWDQGFAAIMTVGVVGSALLLVKLAAFPDLGWLDPTWLRATGDALILRPSEARVSVWGLLVVVIYAWWRGRRRTEPTLDGAYVQFRLGAPIVLLAVAADGLVGSPVSQRAIVGAVLVFFAATLTAIGLARLGGFGRRPDGFGIVAARGRWLGALLAPVLVVLAAGVVVAGLASRDLLETVLYALAPLVWGLSVILRVLVLLIALIAFLVVSPILWLLSGKELDLRRVNRTGDDGAFRESVERELDRVMQVPDALRYLLAFLLLSAIVSMLTRFVLRRRKRTAAALLEDRASVFSPRELLGALRARLRALLGLRPRVDDDPLADLRGDRRWAQTVAIRELYARLLRAGAERGRPRPPSATPTEHARRVLELPAIRSVAGDVRTITERYNSARYGAEPATREEAESARIAWRRIERTLRDG
jgi:hypothetical protein